MDRPWYLERAQQRLLQSPNRRRILERIRAVPGIHMRRLSRDLRIVVGTLEPHLRSLERIQLIVSHKEGRRRSFFAKDQIDVQDVRLLSVLRNRTWRKILVEILNEPGLTFGSLAQRVPRRASTTSYHLRRLQALGLVERAKVGRYAFLRLREPDLVRRLLDAYRPTYRGLYGYNQRLDPARGAAGPSAADVRADDVFRFLLNRALVANAEPTLRRAVPSRKEAGEPRLRPLARTA